MAPGIVSFPRSTLHRPPPQIFRNRRFGHECHPQGRPKLLAIALQFDSILGNGLLQPLASSRHKIFGKLLGIKRLGWHLPATENQQAPGIQRKVLLAFLGPIGIRFDGILSQPAGEELINGLTAEAVVIVLRRELHACNMVAFAKQVVDRTDARILDSRGIASPIPSGRNHEQRAGRGHGSDLDVIRIEAQVGSILANVSSLHEVGNHIDRGCHAHPLVHSRQQERLRPSAGCAGHGNALRVHIRE